MPYVQRKRAYRKRYTRKRTPRTRYNKRGSAVAYRAMRIAKNVSRKVAGELCKFQLTPSNFYNYGVSISGSGLTSQFSFNAQQPLLNIVSGTPWVMPLNWYYYVPLPAPSNNTGIYVNGQYLTPTMYSGPTNYPGNVSIKLPLYYNTLDDNGFTQGGDVLAGLQYRMAYLYIRGIFNASVNNSTDNTDGAVRFVIVKDKQPQGGAATWSHSGTGVYGSNDLLNRGVFTSNLIDAQVNPQTSGRFKIIYDKTMRFTTINGYKPFKYFKRISTIVRNTRQTTDTTTAITLAASPYESSDRSSPVLKNAYYLMIFSDGINFTYANESSTPAAGFHLFSRIGYYNN